MTMGVWHTLVITVLYTLVSLQSVSPTISVNCTDLVSLTKLWPWWVILLSQLLVPVAPPLPHDAAFQDTGDLPRPHGSLLDSFLFSVISLCLLSLSWMNLKRGLWPVALCVKNCYLEHAENTDMRLSLVILSSVERDRRKSSPCHPSEGHQ